ncbi:hypothetical protein L202_04824 [Cryptococcus amylolentus CBS 6039]|uniref:BTB domain-containing protein n=2 Tax=Cryptococcus amylolentus TaxID=104669 RepID=A0A1E3HMX1_9TREE|nr:hypothetical protein L202_04824 [Cryptococcus amylolentus CBS 6039]ODN77674.1 hypothetical protein L202_04824 [Cryptococcus amylolentus CBS 6039]ODO05690.1 hypothetical protein I350_04750 [Cryptococcus amylolentus CBS 6273]
MSLNNPSHLLISRNPPRSPAHPQLDPTLTSRHPGAASSPPATTLGRWVYDDTFTGQRPSGTYNDTTDDEYEESESEDEGPIEVHPTFQRGAELPGRVKVVVGKNEFWCHKEVLWFASPFFEGLLLGNWAESKPRPPSPTLAPPLNPPPDTDGTPSVRGSTGHEQAMDQEPETRDRSSVYHDPDGQAWSLHSHFDQLAVDPSCEGLLSVSQGESPKPVSPANTPIRTPRRARDRIALRASFSSSLHPPHAVPDRPASDSEYAIAEVELHEEKASAFQDFLYWAYPHLECKVTWTNVAPLLSLSTKLIVPTLQKQCSHFLLTHASGRPVVALALAEQYGNAELFREASRFVLDQRESTWDEGEMNGLSVETQLKLSNRRSWFLERLLKLGIIDVKKEYSCRPDCPDPQRCQLQLDEKWRQAHAAVSRYGPPQPSVAFRCLRQLETFPTNPSLSMPHALCQGAAKSWVMSLFDRMFQLKIVVSANPGTEKYWLWISLN